jgi:predicted nucleic acid-binding protein
MIEESETGTERIADLLSETGIQVIDVDRTIARQAAHFRAHSMRAGRKPLTMPDAMIAATAIVARCDLVVGNDREWKKVEGLPFLFLGDITKRKI